MRVPASQRGLALVTALLVVAIVATLATHLALGQQVWLRQAQNLADLAQAERLREGALRFAGIALSQDAKTTKTDHLGEDWAKPLPPLPVDGGFVAISVEDAQARFNLNNVNSSQGAAGLPGPAMFRQLLTALGFDQNLVEPLIDWMDKNASTQPGGAEDIDYLSLEHPYRTANELLTSVDELRLIKGFNEEIVETLRPYVTVLPANNTLININTAPPQVLAALCNLDMEQAEQIAQTLKGQPAAKKEDLIPLLPKGQQCPTNLYDVQTGYFIVTVRAHIGRTQRLTEAVLKRSPQSTTVLWHRQPPLKLVKHEDQSS